MSTFYVKIKGARSGPYDAIKLKQLARAGEIAQDDLVSRDGETNWVKGSNVVGLFPTPNTQPAAQPGIGDSVLSVLSGIGDEISSAAKATGKATTELAFNLTNPGFLTTRRRIAITGLAATGKTVFLTSLLNHLNLHDPSFHLFQNDATAKLFAEKQVHDGLEKFDYELFSRAMQTGRWPQKTVDVSSFACTFKTDSSWGDYQVEFLDWPGERIADVAMAKCNYDTWSDHLLKYWTVEDEKRFQHVAPYLAAVQQDNLSEPSILGEYRMALGRLILDYNPLISPSCFLLGRDGKKLRGTSPEQLASSGIVGVSEDSQFAPLPKAVRNRQPELAAKFSQRYDDYKKEVVSNLVSALANCNRLIVLLDLPSILAAGSGMLHDNCEMVKQMLAGLDARAGFATRVLRKLFNLFAPAMWMWPGIEKIAFVANKADLVAGEANRSNLRALLQEMLRPVVSKIEGVEIGYFVASPVVSTAHPTNVSSDGDRLIGKPMFDDLGNRLPADSPAKSFLVSRVPERWPDRRWTIGEFVFPDVYPALPASAFQLPKQIELDKVLRFILQ